MAKVIDFVFDNDEIAYTDASGCTLFQSIIFGCCRPEAVFTFNKG